MKEVAILLVLTLGLGGCSSLPTTVTTGTGTIWQSAMAGGIGGSADSTGFSFITQFTIASNGALTITNFELENSDTCFNTERVSEAGTLKLGFNSAGTVTGTLAFVITSSTGDTVTLTSTEVTGTYDSSNSILTGGTITGTWTLAPGSSSKCASASGTFIMTQTAAS
jgi:hypothetical protein